MATRPLVADLRHMTANWDASPSRVVIGALPKIALQGRFRGLVLFRAAQALQRLGLTPLASYLQARCLRACAAELHPAAVVGPGLNLVHTTGVVVGHEVVAGRDLVLHQGVTLGHGKSGAGQPRLGDRVRIFAGATLLGPIAVGDDAVVGAGAIVLADVPAGASVVGTWTAARARAERS